MSWGLFMTERRRARERIKEEEERVRKDINWKSAKLLRELGYVWCLAQEEWVSPKDALYSKDSYDPTDPS